LKTFVDTAHAQGIRVIFDIVMNHPGYADLQSLNTLGIEVLWDGWEAATPKDYHSYINYNDFDFTKWWGSDWVRSDLPGYKPGDPNDDLTMQLAYLPDFRTDSTEAVELPAFFANKPDTRVKPIEGYTVRQYLIAWLTEWVRQYGIDGFRCDTAKHVELDAWADLKKAGVTALREWKAANPDKKIDDAEFWMTGEVFPHGVVRDAYFDNGFDNLINFDLQNSAKGIGDDWNALDPIYAAYAKSISSDPTFNVLSYLSSHDTVLFPRGDMIKGGTILLLAPGGVQIFYGDETARPIGKMPASDPQQATRSAMNWDAIDEAVLQHWQTLTQFRKRHVSLAKGTHRKLGAAPYTFARVHPNDRVVVAVGVTGQSRIPVGDVFADGGTVRDAYSGAQAVVSDGAVMMSPATGESTRRKMAIEASGQTTEAPRRNGRAGGLTNSEVGINAYVLP
ncbi:MAG: alpha-amylase family glycosyl hydrolase, partial [Myxococcota bacterium]